MRRIRNLLLPLGALLVAVGALLRWWTVSWTRPLLGDQQDSVTGTAAAPALLVFTLAAVAGWAASAGTRSPAARRVIAVLIAVIGVAISWIAVATAASGPRSVILDRHPEAAAVTGSALVVWGPVLAVLGGGLLAAAGVLILLRRRTRGIGARFERPAPAGQTGAAPGTPTPDGSGAHTAVRARPQHPEDDAALLWKGLDAGDDPTAPGRAGTPAP